MQSIETATNTSLQPVADSDIQWPAPQAESGPAQPRLFIVDRLIGLAGIVVIVLAWEGAVRIGWMNEYYFSSPSGIAASAIELATEGFPRGVMVWNHIQATLMRVLLGFTLATLTAIPLGLVVGTSRLLTTATMPIVTFARSIAAISLLPLMVAWFGVGETSKVALIFFSVFWVVLTNTVYGVGHVDPMLLRAAQALGTSKRDMYLRVILPATIPHIFVGMKVALALSFLSIIAVEMVGTVEGLGALITQARQFYRTDLTMVGMLIISVFGLLLAVGLDRLERTLLPWAVSLDEVER